MIRETIGYTTEEAWKSERAKDLTSTEISALFGLSPYLTAFELWHRHHSADGFEFEPADNERLRWGKRLQQSISSGVYEDQDWCGRPMLEYIRLPELRIGSSFDYRVHAHPNTHTSDSDDDWLLECKNVDSLEFRNSWDSTDFGLEAPAHIECQLQHQLLVSGLKEGYIAALIGGNRIELLRRFYDETIGQRILEEAAKFWAMETPPAPDFHKDAALIGKLYRIAEPGKVIDADARMLDLMHTYDEQGRAKRIAEDEQQAAKAELLTLIGSAEKVLSDEFNVSAKTTAAVEVAAFTRNSYRNVRITARKQK